MARTRQNKKVEEQKILKTTIERITLLRNIRDIATWRSALMIAESRENPDRTRLLEVYKEITDDAHLTAVTQKITFRCTNHKIWWKIDGQRAELDHPINELTSKSFFTDIVKFIIESWWYGHSLIQLNFLETAFDPQQDEGVELIHRPNVRPEFGDILKTQGNFKDAIPFRQTPWANFLLDIGGRHNLGLLNKVAPNVLYKRYGVVDWSEFLEVYGMPIRDIQYDPNVPGQRQEAEKALEGQGANAGIVRPIGSNFDLHDSAKAGNSQAFELNASFHNSEISKALLLQTMTTQDGSSRSQSETHQVGEDNAIWAYQQFVENTLNEKLIPILEKHGWKIQGGQFRYGDTERLKKTAMADILTKISAVAEIPMSYIYEFFNIPEPKPTDKIKDDKALRTQTPDIEKKKLNLNLPNHETCNHQITRSPDHQITRSQDHPITRFAFTPNKITATETELLKEIQNGKLTNGKIPRNHFKALQSSLTSALAEGWTKGSIDFDHPDHLVRTMMESNIARFSAAKDLAMVQQLNEIKNRVPDFNAFKTEASVLLNNYNINWMRSEYNHAVSVSQSAAAFIRQKADADIFPFWRYETVGDARVRQAHQQLDGMVFGINDDDALQFYPPNGFGCRCEGIAESDPDGAKVNKAEDAISAIGGEQFATMQKKGFNINFGNEMQLFARNQEYLSSFNPNKLDHKAFSLMPFRSLKSLPTFSKKTLTSNEAKEWFPRRQGNLGLQSETQIRLKDHLDRPILLDKNTVDDIIIKNQTFLLKKIEGTLQKPDEIWLEEGNLFQRKHIKFFRQKAVITSVAFSKTNKMKIINITLIEDKTGTTIDQIRTGILTFKK